MTHLIGIVSAKGGVGKTSVAINLSYAFSYFNRRTILVDGDISNPNLGIILGIDNASHTLHDSVDGSVHVTKAVHSHESGLHVIPGSIEPSAPWRFSSEGFNNAIMDLVGLCDFVVVDSGSSFTMHNESVIRSVDYIIPVTTPDRTSLADTLRSIERAKNAGKKVIGAIVNRYQGGPYETRLEDIEGYLGIRVLGVIPHDPMMNKMEHSNMPLVLSHPDSPAGVSFKQIAARMLKVQYNPPMPVEKAEQGLNPGGAPGADAIDKGAGQMNAGSNIPNNIIPGQDKDESLFNYFLRRFGLK